MIALVIATIHALAASPDFIGLLLATVAGARDNSPRKPLGRRREAKLTVGCERHIFDGPAAVLLKEEVVMHIYARLMGEEEKWDLGVSFWDVSFSRSCS